MLGDELPRLRVVLHDVGEGQMRPAQREIDRRLFHRGDEMREVVARGQPGEHAVAFPAPRDHLFMDDAVRGEMPAVLRGIGRDALQQPMVIPAERDQDVLLPGAPSVSFSFAAAQWWVSHLI